MAGTDKQLDLKKVKELVDMMIENDLAEVEIVDGDSKIHLKRPGSNQQMVAAMPAMSHQAVLPMQQQPEQIAPNQDDQLVDIKSQMVGTYYSAPSPDSDDFVKPGDSVTQDTVVCVIEAMKVMNEIKAEITGTVEKVMISNGQAVEFGQVLFKVRPV